MEKLLNGIYDYRANPIGMRDLKFQIRTLESENRYV